MVPATSMVDCTTAMKIWVDNYSISDLTRSVHDVWQQVSAEFYRDDDVIRKGLTEEQVKSRVYRVRQKHYGAFLHVFGLENSLVARTNNPLERFNRELNQAFPSPHPNIATFVRVIRDISQNYVAKLTNVAQGRRRRGNRLNAKRRKNAQRAIQESIELPEPVSFSEADACDDSESEEEFEESDDSSTDEFRDTGNDGNEGNHDDGEDVSSDEVFPDYSFEPSECGDEDEIQAANV
ncbi:hypothetical protein ON010_g4194 [Phytophthora cinnamomi]|nr:hypothetical protein ON010_g4194 [Phytophthora cinnamomi]